MSKPTAEFVTWYMLPEQKEFREGVNKEWEPGVGDWVWTEHEVGIVQGWDTLHRVIDGKRPEMQLFSVWREHAWEDGEWSDETFHRYQLSWLPSLSDLLRMVEAASESITHDCIQLSRWSYEGEYSMSLVTTRCGENAYPYGSDSEKEPAIAAAELLRRLWGVG